MKLKRLKNYWRKINSHNFTTLGFNSYSKNLEKEIHNGIVDVGRFTYGEIVFSSFGDEMEHLHIGDFCSIAGEVRFILGGNHRYDCFTTYPVSTKLLDGKSEAITNGPIVIENDVWIGQRAIILSGVHIGQGAVIAAGSVVSKNIPPYAIAAGVPARVLKYRFSTEIIEQLLTVDFSKINKSEIIENVRLLHEPINNRNIEEIMHVFSDGAKV